MKDLFFTLCLTCLCTFACAQSITGRISDGEQYLPSAAVLLLRTDSSLVKGVVTDSAGRFSFKKIARGRYIISASMVGYSRYFAEVVSAGEADLVIPEIALAGTSEQLDEVIVASKVQTFDQKMDRLVINVQSNITYSGNSVLEVIQKSPGIVVNRQNSTISMNGKTGVRVMVNEKIVQLPFDVIVQMLDGMSASNVERIELMTTPPAKYDAEGNAGIIHIVTKENPDFGTSASFGFSAGMRWAEAFNANASVNHRGKRVAYFADYSVLRSHNLHEMKMERRMAGSGSGHTISDNSRRENLTIQQNLTAGFEWQLRKNTVLHALITGYKRNWDLNAVATDINRADADSIVTTVMKIHEDNVWQSATGSIGMQTVIGARSKLDVNLDYLYYHNNNPSTYDVNTTYSKQNESERSEIDLKKTTPIRFVVAKADYQYEVSPSMSVEAGVKGVTSSLDNNVLVERAADGEKTIDSAFSSSSTLHEQIGAAYISSRWNKGKVQVNGGLRYEYTHTSIGTPFEKDLVNRKYGYFFPSLSMQKNIKPERDIGFSYSRRITRPTYNDIAPFVFLWGLNTFSAGNTSLYPSVVDAVGANYHLKAWIVSLQYSHSRKEIAFLQPEVDNENGNLIYRSQNLRYMNTISMANSWSMDVTPWWEIQNNITTQYQLAKTSHLENNETLRLFGVNVNIINQVRLPHDLSIEISGMYNSKLIAGVSEYLPFGALNFGIQKDLKEKGILRLSGDDIFNTNNWRIKSNSAANQLDAYFVYRWHNRFIRLSYTRNIGNNKMKSVKLRSGSDEERKRVSN